MMMMNDKGILRDTIRRKKFTEKDFFQNLTRCKSEIL